MSTPDANQKAADLDVEKSGLQHISAAETTANLVNWEGSEDPQNPMNWSTLHKWIIIALVSTITFNVFAAPAFSCLII